MDVYEGTNGSIVLLEDGIVIRRKGMANFLTQGLQGDKKVPFSSITAVQFREPGPWIAGVIQFTLLGGREFPGGMLEATKDENAIIFEKNQRDRMSRLRDHIQTEIGKPVRPAYSAPPVSAADELCKFATLVDKGYMTRDEFDERKRVLLGQMA